jgi:glycosyltransferase involved in cell wall biosynthesis
VAFRVLFLAERDEQEAASRCRVYQYVPFLKARGIDAEVVAGLLPAREIARRARAVDAVVVQRRVLTPLRLLALRRAAKRLLFDFDDSIWLRRDRSGRIRSVRWPRRLRLAVTVRMSDAIIAGNEYLAAWARPSNPAITIVPTPVDPAYYASGASAATPANGALRLSWVGGADNLVYLRRLEPAFAAVARAFPKAVLRVVSSAPFESSVIRVENVRWSLADEVANLAAAEIGLMPLEDDAWTRGKCAYKALQYMAVGVPVVCSPVGMNAEVVVDGTNGFLATTVEQWTEKLLALAGSSDLRRAMGERGRKLIEEKYSVEAMADRLAAALRDAK